MEKKNSGDSDWVVESVVQFLKSPLWNVPVLTYIEEHSIIFDPSIEEHEEYGKKHEQYKDLVGILISSYIEDMGMTQKQFIEACDKDSSKSTTHYRQGLFEQIWAADDYEIFKRMMTQKNVELELQALHLIRQRNGVMPESMQATGLGDEETLMQEVLRLSKEEYEAEQRAKDVKINKDLEMAIAKSKVHQQLLEAEQNVEKALLNRAVKLSINSHDDGGAGEAKGSDVKVKSAAVTKPIETKPVETKPVETKPVETKPVKTKAVETKGGETKDGETKGGETKPAVVEKKVAQETGAKVAVKPDLTGEEAAANWLADAKTEAQHIVQQTRAKVDSEVSAEELERRREYLKQQRDRLIALKRTARGQELARYEKQQIAGGGKQRPKSAKAARSVGKTGGDSSGIDEKTLATRQALAAKLRNEVINSEEFK